ncbi:MAG: VOC family protein [Gammaproteobacteria bacterium]
MIIGIHHAQITVPRGKEDDARRFYCGILGLKEVEKPASLQGRGGFWLQAGNAQVHVGTEDGVERNLTKAHVAYEVSDLGHWQKVASVNGIETVPGEDFPGHDRFEFRDPFGNRIELIQRL